MAATRRNGPHSKPIILLLHVRSLVNSLTAKCVLTGTKNSLLEDYLLAKQTSHKDPHHDELLSPIASWFLWMNIHHPRGPLRKGLDEAANKGFSINYKVISTTGLTVYQNPHSFSLTTPEKHRVCHPAICN